MNKYYFIYIIANSLNTVLYVGITNNLKKRIFEHKEKLVEGFTKRYNESKLVYYELFEDPESAIIREKQLKGGSRKRKEELINSINPEWFDLYPEL
jgi:putative endonuclease